MARWGVPPGVPGYFSHPSAQVLRTSCCMSKGVVQVEKGLASKVSVNLMVLQWVGGWSFSSAS